MNRLWFKWFGVKVNAYGRNMIWAVLVDDEPSQQGDIYILWGTPDRLRTKLFFGARGTPPAPGVYNPWYSSYRRQLSPGPGIRERIDKTRDKNYKEIKTLEEIEKTFPGLLDSIEMDFTFRQLQK